MRVPGHQRKSYGWGWTAALAGLAVVAFTLVMALVVAPAERVQAATFTVNIVDTTDINPGIGVDTGHADDADDDDTNGNGIVDPGETPDGDCDVAETAPVYTGLQCSLRAALFEADGTAASDTINLPSSGTITLLATLTFAENNVTVNASGVEISAPGAIGIAINITADNVRINNGVLDGESSTATGIQLAATADDAVLNAMTIRSFTGDGVFQVGAGARGKVLGSTITANGDDGIDWGGSPDSEIGGNTITNNTGDGLETGSADGLVVRDNTFSGNLDNQVNVLALGAGQDMDFIRNNITAASDGIELAALVVAGANLDIGLVPADRNVFRGAITAPAEQYLRHLGAAAVDAENNDWNAYIEAAIEGLICHNVEAGCGAGVVDFVPFIGASSPLPTPTPTITITPTPGTPTATNTPAATATSTPGPATATPTVTPTPAMASVTLVGGACNPVASTYPDNTPIATIAGAVSPSGILISIWWFNPGASAWLGYSPQFPQVSNLNDVDRLEAIFICVTSAGTWSRPII